MRCRVTIPGARHGRTRARWTIGTVLVAELPNIRTARARAFVTTLTGMLRRRAFGIRRDLSGHVPDVDARPGDEIAVPTDIGGTLVIRAAGDRPCEHQPLVQMPGVTCVTPEGVASQSVLTVHLHGLPNAPTVPVSTATALETVVPCCNVS